MQGKQSPLIKLSTRYKKKYHSTEGKNFSAFHNNYAYKCLLLLQILPSYSYRHYYNVGFLDSKFTFKTICIKGGAHRANKIQNI